MKFGKNHMASLARNQVPEWAGSYINYKGLKKIIRAAVETSRAGEKVDLAEFFFSLDRNLEVVESFYDKRFAETHRSLKLLEERHGNSPNLAKTLNQDEIEELLGALVDLRGTFRKLQWFGEINRRGFVKITKKLDKKIPEAVFQTRYISTKVDPKPFAKEANITTILVDINKWLSLAGEVQKTDDGKREKSTWSIRTNGEGLSEYPPHDFLEAVDAAINEDDKGNDLKSQIERHLPFVLKEFDKQTLLLSMLQRSISARSKKCIAVLLEFIPSLEEPTDINGRNCLHRLVIHTGRTQGPGTQEVNLGLSTGISQHRHPSTGTKYQKTDGSVGEEDEAVTTLICILDNLREPTQRAALVARDSLGRMPLHYAAEFGFVVACNLLQARMASWSLLDSLGGIDSDPWQDKDGHAPLHLAVLGGHTLCAKSLLDNASGGDKPIAGGIPETSQSLVIATKANSPDVVELLVQAGVDINWQDSKGETALHTAARFGHKECARILVEGGANLETVDNMYKWTPLDISAVDGHFDVVELLVKAGADVGKLDSSGWNAKEHAALRGHLRIATLLMEHMPEEGDSSAPGEPTPNDRSSLRDQRSKPTPALPEPMKAFGHRYLTKESLVLLSLGSMDMRKSVDAVKLDQVSMTSAHLTQMDTAISLVVSASEASGQPVTIDLPVHETISTEPIVFSTIDPSKVRLMFDIVPTYVVGDSNKNKVARAAALLGSVKPALGSTHGERACLVGDITVPLLAVSDMSIIGTVHFNVLVITPFEHPNMEVTSHSTYWRKSISSPQSEPMVIGHRGLGKNTSSRSLQLGENTVESFVAAGNLGANYVEFDVQLTKDHVPVIYHDFFVSETGIDAPVHTLTLDQFMHMNPAADHTSQQHASEDPGPYEAGSRSSQNMGRTNAPGPRTRSLSHGIPGTGSQHPDHRTPSAADERMKHTHAIKTKGFKANSRGNFIQAPFATLSQLFAQVPPETGFNIELKYPMLHESQAHAMDAYAVELNSFVDAVLRVVYGEMGERRVIFSSFNPDLCLCLSFKQPSIPVLFLTDATADDAGIMIGDVRASSLQEAVRFARRWNLLGIVAHADVFCMAPRLVGVVKGAGLVCVSYGVLNNRSDMVKKQVDQGIDAVIVDSVLAIRKGLTTGAVVGRSSGGTEEKREDEGKGDDK